MSTELTQSFIEMVKAYEAKPELEAQIKTLGEDNAMCYKTIEQLRLELDTRDHEIVELKTKLVEVTKERDDASFRNLELDEKLSGIEKLLGVAERLEQARREGHQAGVDAMTPKPEPVDLSKAPIPGDPWYDLDSQTGPIDPVVVSGQSAADPTMSDGNVSEAGTSIPTEPSFDQYEESTWKGQPYGNKPWWVEDDVWYVAGGLMA